ncbi:hypothetical protein [Nocardioides sp. 616]|uniref:hypothetical protein n=1 Tax=Nocardioides sp. 616 TaxID=2268090 RepID=UPI000CE442C1|nr:hypothetical protein [Nocardioides sp. 616]
MGAWGPAIFSDDTACDIRSDYRELLEDGVDDAEATQRVIADYQHLAHDEAHVPYLALAAAQSGLGRLEDSVKLEALRVIDAGVGLELWAEAGDQELAKRKAVLSKLRATLTGPQKPPTKVRRPWSDVTDLSSGDVLAYTLPDGKFALFRVARHRKKDEDWREVGFTLVGRVTPSSGDASFAARTYTSWRSLRTSLDNGW